MSTVLETQRQAVGGHVAVAALQQGQSLLALTLGDECHGQLGKREPHPAIHTHRRGIEVDARALHLAVAVAMHQVVVGPGGVEHHLIRIVTEGGETLGNAFGHEVFAEVQILRTGHAGTDVERSAPVGVGQHLEEGQLALVETATACQRDHHTVGNLVVREFGRRATVGRHHATLAHGLLVDVQIDGVGWNHLHVLLLRAHPVAQDVAQFERLVAKLPTRFLRVLRVEVEHLPSQVGLYGHVVALGAVVVGRLPGYGQPLGVGRRSPLLVDVPVGGQVVQVAHAHVGALALHFLHIPKRERVVVAVAEEDGITFLLARREEVVAEVAARGTVGTVVVVPVLRGHE